MKLSPIAGMALLAGVCLLASCGQKSAAPAAAGASGPGAAAQAGPDVEINVADLPRPRAGLWRTVISNADGSTDTETHCVSGAKPNITPGRMPSGCAQFTIKRTFLGAIVMDMSCGTSQFTVSSHAVATGDFQTGMTTDSVMTMSGPHIPARTTKMHTEAHWLGPCPPGQSPDDAPTQATG